MLKATCEVGNEPSQSPENVCPVPQKSLKVKSPLILEAHKLKYSNMLEIEWVGGNLNLTYLNLIILMNNSWEHSCQYPRV